MTGISGSSYEKLSRRLGYAFSNTDLLRQALTHSSARARRKGTGDNERLEFLGDRVLGLCVAELLFQEFPKAEAGELALRLNRLVRKETCAEVAEADWGLGEFMIMSGNEAQSGGRHKLTILGNGCEAILGAIFLDSSYDEARSVIRTFWGPRLIQDDVVPTDAKTALQEWAQGRGLPLPNYAEASRKGPDHAPLFTARVEVKGLKPAQGSGSSKRIAEQTAAEAMLLREGIWSRDRDND